MATVMVKFFVIGGHSDRGIQFTHDKLRDINYSGGIQEKTVLCESNPHSQCHMISHPSGSCHMISPK